MTNADTLTASLDRALHKLKQLYPEQQIFALDALDNTLYDRLGELAKRAGYSSTRQMLQEYGYQFIAGEAVRQLRPQVIYPPGSEPPAIQKKLHNLLNTLLLYYPDRVINGRLESEHKKVSGRISALYRWLGYADKAAMLAAYGFTYNLAVSPRQEGETPPGDKRELLPDLPGAADPGLFDYAPNPRGGLTITGYRGQADILIIPSVIAGCQVTAIGKGAFQERQHLTQITLPDCIVTLQGRAFQNCLGLQRVRLSNSISRLMGTLFNGCGSLREINIPDQVTALTGAIFKDCPLTSLHIGKGLTSLSSRHFFKGRYAAKTRGIKNLSIDPANTSLRAQDCCVFSADGRRLYAALNDQASYSLPDGLEIISEAAFANMYQLREILLPASLQEIGPRAFAGCPRLQTLTLPAGIRRIDPQAFVGSKIILRQVGQ